MQKKGPSINNINFTEGNGGKLMNDFNNNDIELGESFSSEHYSTSGLEEIRLYNSFEDVLSVYCSMTENMMEAHKTDFSNLLKSFYENGLTANDAIRCFAVCFKNIADSKKEGKNVVIENNNIGLIFELIYLDVKPAEKRNFLELLVYGNFDKSFLTKGRLENDLILFEKNTKDDKKEEEEDEIPTLRKKKMTISLDEDEKEADIKDDNTQKSKVKLLNKKDVNDRFLCSKRRK